MICTTTGSATPAASSSVAAPCRRPWNGTSANPWAVANRLQYVENVGGSHGFAHPAIDHEVAGVRVEYPCRAQQHPTLGLSLAVPPQRFENEPRRDQPSSSRPRLGRPPVQLAAGVGEGPLDADGALVEVDLGPPKTEDFFSA